MLHLHRDWSIIGIQLSRSRADCGPSAQRASSSPSQGRRSPGGPGDILKRNPERPEGPSIRLLSVHKQWSEGRPFRPFTLFNERFQGLRKTSSPGWGNDRPFRWDLTGSREICAKIDAAELEVSTTVRIASEKRLRFVPWVPEERSSNITVGRRERALRCWSVRSYRRPETSTTSGDDGTWARTCGSASSYR